ncbi:unnamed protein product [Cylindrotheca closterium]|uniref:Uncharacterized protein n=1 Tax=Cylindrotheca closterium TaxID=2856 RepID=A0AAD2CCF9_9STRA|nr:unnamed protein product [Cylindrotheca closterium]
MAAQAMPSDDQVQTRMEKEARTLRAGAIIEYYDPIGVCGDSQWFRRSVIIGVEQEHRTCIILNSGPALGGFDRVKRIGSIMPDGQVIASEGGVYMDVKDYHLVESHFEGTGKQGRNFLAEVKAEVDCFWNNNNE